MKTINRCVFLLKMKEPFLEWLNNLPSKHGHIYTFGELNEDLPAFLMPESDLPMDAKSFCHKNAKKIFAVVLESWWTDEADWIKDCSPSSFDHYFEILQGEIIVDLGRGKIVQEDY